MQGLIFERWGDGWTVRRRGINQPVGQGGSKGAALADLYRQERGKTGPTTPQQSPRSLMAGKKS